MTSLPPWQDLIPEPVLLYIFSFLEPKSLLRASQTCHRWHRIARDESLWKHLLKTNWQIKDLGTLSTRGKTWYSEYKRLYYHAPTQFSERIEGHTDEVLDVAFSHDGRYFCTTSKDTKVKIWELGNPTQLKFSADLGLELDWNMTQYAAFNRDDSYLLVCGVKFQPPTAGGVSPGLGAIFRMKDFHIIQEMPMDPPHLFADWFNNNICVGGYVPAAANNDFFCVKAFKVDEQSQKEDIPVKSPFEDGIIMYSFYGDSRRAMNLLVAKVPQKESSSKDHIEDAKLDLTSQSGGLSNSDASLKHCVEDQAKLTVNFAQGSGSEPGPDLLKTFQDFHIAPTNHTKDISSKTGTKSENGNHVMSTNHKNSNLNCMNTSTKFSVVKTAPELPTLTVDICDKCGQGSGECLASGGALNFCDKCGHVDNDLNKAMPDSLTYETYMIFVTGGHNAIAFEKVDDLPEKMEKKINDQKALKLKSATVQSGNLSTGSVINSIIQLPTVQNPTKTVHLPGHYISGMKLSSDHRFLFFNYRCQVDDLDDMGYPKLLEDMEVKALDLQTFQLVPELKFSGHKGFSDYPAWYICLDTCQDYIASGSEEYLGYLWDKHYRICLAKLQHREGVVNGVGFNPVDSECLVTVADDHIINIWRSRNRKKQLEEH